MPRQQVYGKRSRAVYNPAATAFDTSSPEQPAPKPTKAKPATVKKIVLEKEDEDPKEVRQSPRRALGEKQANSVVLPLEALDALVNDRQTRKPRVRRKEAECEPRPIQKIEQDGRVAGRGRHTFFDDGPIEPEVAEPKEQEEELLQPRRSPRKIERREQDDEDARTKVTEPELIISPPLEEDLPPINTTPQTARNPDCPYEHHCSDLLNLSTHALTSFFTWSIELSEHFSLTKIAEASFGEVYRLSLLEDITDFCSTDESVFKVIPLQAPESLLPVDKRKRAAALRKAEGMSKPFDVANEVKLLQRMSSVPGFTNFRDVRILQGRPPEAFIGAFKAWNASQKAKKKELSHFPDPSKKASYTDDQLWAVIEMQDAGNDLERLVESGSCTSIFPIWDIFWQTVLSIAKGEEGAEFEHRDLHLGNICVRSADPLPSTEEPIDTKRKLGFTSLETTIIDYTISRCLMTPSSISSDANDQDIAYTDLSLPSQSPLFEGDSTEEYQYDIYRYMRGALYLDSPLAEIHTLSTSQIAATGRNWKQFHPQTNLVWLHLVLYKLLEQLEWPSSKKAPPKKKQAEHKLWKRANDLEFVLLKIQDLLDPNAICANGIRSASDLVGFAVGEGWLDLEDVLGGSVDEADLVSQLDGLEI